MSTDLLVMKTSGGSGRGAVTLNLFSEPALTSGIQILSQRFLTLLLRDYDERTGLGTSLVRELQSSRIVNDPFLIGLVGQSVLQVQEQLPEVGEPDELLSSVQILAAYKTGDSAFIQLQLTSQSDETTTLELPRIL